jgi:PAS domain S-box-containing protein
MPEERALPSVSKFPHPPTLPETDLYRLLVESARDYAIFALDPYGTIMSWNPGAQRAKGYTAEEIIGKHFSTFYTPEDRAREKPKYMLETARREGRAEDEGWRVRKDGTRFWADVIITPLYDNDHNLLGFGKVTRDLTERRESQEQAIADARRIAEVEAANKAKSDFLAAMSHELRTPLNAVGGYAELIEMGVGGPVTNQQREYLQRIRSSQQHLLAVINDLLNYSKVESGQVSYEIEPVRTHDVLENVLSMVTPQAIKKGIEIVHGPCPLDSVALADRMKVEQVVLNLLSNAVKFTPKGGRVMATCGKTESSVLLAISDTGPGIPADKLQEIFEPFVQLGRSLSALREGTGLGLAISRDLARAMNGDITVESTLGKGSVFTVELPRG